MIINPPRMDMKTLVKDLFDSETKKQIAILSISDDDIVTDDFDEDRIINYHLKPPSKQWLESRFVWTESTKTKYKAVYEASLIKMLLRTDQNMFVTLNHIIFIDQDEDISHVCAIIESDSDEWPECIDFEENTTLGCHWWSQSCIIINTAAITKTLAEMKEEYQADGLYFNEVNEEWIAIATTLLHELRHLGLSNPFLDTSKYPKREETEKNIEAWALSQFESL